MIDTSLLAHASSALFSTLLGLDLHQDDAIGCCVMNMYIGQPRHRLQIIWLQLAEPRFPSNFQVTLASIGEHVSQACAGWQTQLLNRLPDSGAHQPPCRPSKPQVVTGGNSDDTSPRGTTQPCFAAGSAERRRARAVGHTCINDLDRAVRQPLCKGGGKLHACQASPHNHNLRRSALPVQVCQAGIDLRKGASLPQHSPISSGAARLPQ